MVVAGLVVGLQVVLAVGRRFEPVEVQAVLRDQELRVGVGEALLGLVFAHRLGVGQGQAEGIGKAHLHGEVLEKE